MIKIEKNFQKTLKCYVSTFSVKISYDTIASKSPVRKNKEELN